MSFWERLLPLNFEGGSHALQTVSILKCHFEDFIFELRREQSCSPKRLHFYNVLLVTFVMLHHILFGRSSLVPELIIMMLLWEFFRVINYMFGNELFSRFLPGVNQYAIQYHLTVIFKMHPDITDCSRYNWCSRITDCIYGACMDTLIPWTSGPPGPKFGSDVAAPVNVETPNDGDAPSPRDPPEIVVLI